MKPDLMKLGLTGLARAAEIGWFPGHFGAAVLTAGFLRQREDLAADIKENILRNAMDIVEKNPRFFIPHERSDVLPGANVRILEAIRPNLERLTLSGHGVIYGSLALKALKARPELATRAIVEGMEKLLAHTLKDRGVRYYGTDDYKAVKEVDIAPYHSIGEMIVQTFAEAKTVFPDQRIGDGFYYFSSEKLHSFTYAQALSDLFDLGYEDFAKAGLNAHRFQVGLSRQTPPNPEPKKFTDEEAEAFSPMHPSYWQRDHFDDHALKFAYAVMSLNDKKMTTIEKDLWLKFAR